MRYLVAVAVTLSLWSCSEPRCPSGYMQFGDICRRCKLGDSWEDGGCVGRGDAGDPTTTPESDADAEREEERWDAEAVGDAGAMLDADETKESYTGAVTDAAFDAGSDAALDASDDRDECVPCENEGQCENDGTRYSCRCAPGFDGPQCQRNIDECAPNPCQNGGTCRDRVNGYTCSCPSPFTGDQCELEICATVSIHSRADLSKYKSCSEVTGDLNIQPDFPELGSTDLSHLATVRGGLTIFATSSTPQKITLQALTTVEGALTFTGSPNNLKELRLPSLKALGAATGAVAHQIVGYANVIEMPQLETIYGNVGLVNGQLCSADLRRVQRVAGNLMMSALPNLPYSSVAPLIEAVEGAASTNPIGCCTFVDTKNCESFDRAMCSSFMCP
jgi:hypothetical protein